MKRRQSIIHSLAVEGSLDSDVIPGIPIVEICDQRRVLIENHCGIVAYGRNEIHVKVRFGRICINGNNLKLKQMSKNKLIITGVICAVNLQGRG